MLFLCFWHICQILEWVLIQAMITQHWSSYKSGLSLKLSITYVSQHTILVLVAEVSDIEGKSSYQYHRKLTDYRMLQIVSVLYSLTHPKQRYLKSGKHVCGLDSEWTRYCPVAGYFEHSTESSNSVKDEEFVKQLIYSQSLLDWLLYRSGWHCNNALELQLKDTDNLATVWCCVKLICPSNIGRPPYATQYSQC
jgi:hypothetical protein